MSSNPGSERASGFRIRNEGYEFVYDEVLCQQEGAPKAAFDEVLVFRHQQIFGQNHEDLFEKAFLAKEVG